MTTRSVAVVLALALTASAVAGCGKSRAARAAARATDDALAYMPRDTVMMFGVDVKQVRGTQVGDALAEDLADSAELRRFERACGFDPMAAIDHLTVGITDTSRVHPSGVFVATGDRLERLLDCAHKLEDHVTRKGKFVHIGGSTDVVLGMAKSGALVGVFGFSPKVSDLEDVLALRRTVKDDRTMTELLDAADTGAPTWFVLDARVIDGGEIQLRGVGASVRFDKTATVELFARFDSSDDAAEALGDVDRLSLRTRDLDDVGVKQDGKDIVVTAVASKATFEELLDDLRSGKSSSSKKSKRSKRHR